LDLLSATKENERQKEITQQQNPLYSFMYALKSSEARRQYPKRLKMLFDFIKLPGSLGDQAQQSLNNICNIRSPKIELTEHVLKNIDKI
jgi:hypothetical protein